MFRNSKSFFKAVKTETDYKELDDIAFCNSVEHLLQEYSRQKQINKEHKKINEGLREKVKELEKENEELLEVKISVSAENTIQNLKRENIKLEERCFIAEGNLKTTKEELRDYFYNSIPKQKIKDKIEELKGKLNTDNTIRLYTLKDSYELQITILNELLEEKEGGNKGNGD